MQENLMFRCFIYAANQTDVTIEVYEERSQHSFFWLYFILIVSSAINQTNDDTVYWSIFISPVGLLQTWINFNPTMDK